MSTLTHAYGFQPPVWARDYLTNPPKHGRLRLASFPTPLYKIDVESHVKHPSATTDNLANRFFSAVASAGANLYIKRDDCSSGVELGGNKIRKLEFLLAEALAEGCDSVVTIGGEQSNHCRATAAASRMVGLKPRLILRTRKEALDLTGNLLVDRMVGSEIFTCTPGEYGRVGSDELVARVCQHLKSSQQEKPYAIPVGGSNGLGSWGYVNAVDELVKQCDDISSGNLIFDKVVFACGSGGTATGIALGLSLAYGSLNPTVKDKKVPEAVAVGVCDDPDYFYGFSGDIAQEMGLKLPNNSSKEEFLRRHMTVLQGKGLGYAVSTEEELKFVAEFAKLSGVVLDPVYSGKALYTFARNVLENVEDYKGADILFWHTGGALGLYEKAAELPLSKVVQKLDIYCKENGVDISVPSNE